MMGLVPIGQVQFVCILILSYPTIYWLISVARYKRNFKMKKIENPRYFNTTILLPMRNECNKLECRIRSVVDEIKEFDMINLLVIDSASSDDTYQKSMSVLGESGLSKKRWKVLKSSLPGKSLAINIALRDADDEIMIIMDADVQLDSGWLDTIQAAFADPEVAAVSGIEQISAIDSMFSIYKKF